jgi:5-methylcytosine-specific restriction endonuclease McrA
MWDARGQDASPNGWEAHHIDPAGEPVLENCRILCMECHKNTPSYGTGQQAGTVTTAQVSPEAKGP